MDRSPYAPPESPIAEPISDPELDLAVAIASAQRHVLWALLVAFLCTPVLVLWIFTAPMCAFFVYRLARRVYPTVVAVALTLLSVPPFFGLLVILAVNSRATKALRDRGLHVGFLGVDPRTLELAAARE